MCAAHRNSHAILHSSLSPIFGPKHSGQPGTSAAWASDYMAQGAVPIAPFEQETRVHLCDTSEIWEFISIACIYYEPPYETSHSHT